jgi:hypothetical protein
VFVDEDAHIFKSQNPPIMVVIRVLFCGAVNVPRRKAELMFCRPVVMVVCPEAV